MSNDEFYDDFDDPGEFDLPSDFNPLSTDWSQGDEPIDDIASEQGWNNWADVIAPRGDYDLENVRPGMYYTPQDAIRNAYDVGILEFSRIIFNPVTGFWYLVVEYEGV